MQWTAVARAASAAPPEVRAANDLALWYDESAGTDWLRALPIGNGRSARWCSATSTPSGCSSTRTPSGPAARTTRQPGGAAALAEIRRLVFADQWSQAQSPDRPDDAGQPGGQLAYQPVGNLRLAFGSASGVSQYNRTLDLTTATTTVRTC